MPRKRSSSRSRKHKHKCSLEAPEHPTPVASTTVGFEKPKPIDRQPHKIEDEEHATLVSSQEYFKDKFDSCQLYISNLPDEATMQDLHLIYPEAVSATLGLNKNREGNTAEVEFNTSDETYTAYERTKSLVVKGRRLIVSPKIVS